ncbi:MAG: hypothetical protein WC246_01535 [Candidatus Paceibacterota bacterium]|jgi:hypothetical protein
MSREIPHNGTENYHVMRKMTADEAATLLDFFHLPDEHPEYIIIPYPNKTVYIHKWTRIPHIKNNSQDPHLINVISDTDEVGLVVAKELEKAREAFAAIKAKDIDKIEPIK